MLQNTELYLIYRDAFLVELVLQTAAYSFCVVSIS